MQIDGGMGLSSLVVSCIVPVSAHLVVGSCFVLLGFSWEMGDRPIRLTYDPFD